MICILEDLHKERYEAASEAAPAAKGEMDMHRMIAGFPFCWPHLWFFPSLFCLPFHCMNPLLSHLLMFKVSSKKLIFFASHILCMSLFLSLILNYSWEVDNVVLISACLMKSETSWVKFSKFASPVAWWLDLERTGWLLIKWKRANCLHKHKLELWFLITHF